MEFTTLSKAVSKIRDGSFITFSGMELNRAPMALIFEIAKQGKKNLKTVSIPNPLATDVLIKAGCVKHATFGFNGFSYEDGFIIAPNWQHAIENSLIGWKETDILEILQALKACANCLRKVEIPYFCNTDYLKFNDYKKSNGKIFTKPLNPDFALIHAQYADKHGNVFIEDPLIDKLIATASNKVIVSVEKVVNKLDKITIPKDNVDCIVKAKGGALPTSCFKFYEYDAKEIYGYVNESKKNVKKNTNLDYVDNMIKTLAEFIKDGTSVATGVASPLAMIAVTFAKKSGRKFNYFNCGSGAINPVMSVPSYSSVTIKALESLDSFISLPEVWDYAINGNIDLMFFGAVQISKKGDVNITCIGDYKKPKVKLPGPAGAVTLRNICKNSIIITQHHTKRTFVDKVDFVTSSTQKDTIVVTNLGVLKLGKKPEILVVYPNSSIEEIKNNTGFELDEKVAIKSSDINGYDLKILSEIDPRGMRYKLP